MNGNDFHKHTKEKCSFRGKEQQSTQRQTATTVTTTNSMSQLGRELTAMSAHERNQINDEIHGIAETIQETPEMAETHVLAMKAQLKSIPRKDKKDLDRAFFLRPSLEDDQAFLMMFLRGRRFNVTEAAICLCAYFRNKRIWFGEKQIVTHLTLKHFTEGEINVLTNYPFHFLKDRDSKGRALFISTVRRWDLTNRKALIRGVWYLVMSEIEGDVELQKKGIVMIYDMRGQFSVSDFLNWLENMEELNKHWPVHVNAIHACCGSSITMEVLQSMQVFIPRIMRVRQRVHFGSTLEIQHTLMTFGINVQDWLTEETEADPFLESEKKEWVSERQRKEAQTLQVSLSPSTEDGMTTPHPKETDVLVVRSPFVWDWPGNLLLSRVVKVEAPRYANAMNDRFSKNVIVLGIIQTMQLQHQSRFLERTSTGWRVAKEFAVHSKITKAFRNAIKAASIDKSESG